MRLLIGGGTSFDATHSYASAQWREMFSINSVFPVPTEIEQFGGLKKAVNVRYVPTVFALTNKFFISFSKIPETPVFFISISK